MEKVLQAKPDALYMFLPAGSPSIAFVKGYVERGLKAAGTKLLGSGETQQLFLPNFTDDVIGTVTGFHYTRDQHQSGESRAQGAAREDVRRQGRARYCLGRRLGRHRPDPC